jgi:hypothetical protein
VHLLLGDLAMVGLVSGKEVVESPQSTIMISFQAQCLVYPGADTLRPPLRIDER